MPDARVHNQFALDGAWNFRDLGGVRTVDGSKIRPGKFYRASELSALTESGQRAVLDLGIRTVFDLRGNSEIVRSGVDRVPDGVQSISMPFRDDTGDRAPHEAPIHDEQSQVDYLHRSYATYPVLPGAAHAIKHVVEAVAAGRGGVLVHCAAGKDRAGWTVATVLRAVGVSEDEILADYLASNAAVEPLLAHVRRTWAGIDDADVPGTALLGVRASYLERGMQAVTSRHGSFEGYLSHLGIDEHLRGRLVAELVQD
ncbi:phosphotyrosine protein phosphatase [Rhodococcus sp. Leaf278]|uniref:tyrosine-protein phosphatase n=1 Tax=Rhodococcus sp. Leaf278 TaxID=1736319 RepID=UPI00070F4642|nr:tyrosine-protein phosphatase [Rhodococcus sp. Leaf278]KQU59058.1 phosphotyrosine protein phosphatase [Rhodococcus sp. Leaf278]